MNLPQIAQQLRDASARLRVCVEARDWAGANRADQDLRHWLAEAGRLPSLSPLLHEHISHAGQTLRRTRLQLDAEGRRLGEEMQQLRQQQEGAQAYARHDLPLDRRT